jgi:hypothetical protein
MSSLRSAWKLLRRAVRAVLLALAAVVVFIEEVGWRPLSRWMGRLARWPPLAWLEERIRRVSPRWALVLFLVPAVLLFPLKLLALWLIHLGRAPLGITVIVVAKLVGTALVGRLFVLTEPQLVQFPWFARALGWWRHTKRRVKDAVLASGAWALVRRLRRRVRIVLRRFAR